MPSHTRPVELKYPETVLLADLYGIKYDLALAAELCDRVAELWSQERRDFRTEEGVALAAVVTYCRCFTKGVRLSLKLDDLAALDDKDRELHQYYDDLRDKCIAHAVNAYEETIVTAATTIKDGVKLPIANLGSARRRIVIGYEQIRDLRRLIEKVLAALGPRISSEEKAVLQFVQSLPLDEVHAGDMQSPLNVGKRHVRLSRSRGVNARRK